MGQGASQLDPRHVNIQKKLIGIRDPTTRLQMIDTLMGDPNVVASAKFVGVYGKLLQQTAAVRHGGAPILLPGETSVTTSAAHQPSHQQVPTQLQYHPQAFQMPTQHTGQMIPQANQRPASTTTSIQAHQAQQQTPYQQVAKPKRSEKALNFFTACLRVLNIQEEVALTEATLRSAQKKAAIRSHPDKGGSKDAFDAVTRAQAYLTDILKLVQGRQARTNEAVPELQGVQEQRTTAAKDWQMPEQPVKLNPKNLNMTAFNQLFEQTRIPDPDEDGQGDWLKDETGKNGKKMKNAKKFSEEFNQEVFNRMFEEEAAANKQTAIQTFQHPQELMLNANYGVEIGRDRPSDQTAAPNSDLQFTDLRAAQTTENTIGNQVKGVRVENRSFDTQKAQREKAPENYNAAEMAQLQAQEAQQKAREEQRRIRAAQEQVGARDYFERMKQLLIVDK